MLNVGQRSFRMPPNSKEHAKPVHTKKRLNNSSICGHGYSQKRVMKKHLEFVHSKDKVNNCSICYFSFLQNRHFRKT